MINPYQILGVSQTATQDEIKKLGVDHSDWEIGDVFPLEILAKVVGKNSNESEG